VYLRGGTIIPRRERARRSTAAMAGDPITLVRERAARQIAARLVCLSVRDGCRRCHRPRLGVGLGLGFVCATHWLRVCFLDS
jgi:hypothetical protein